MPNDDVLQDKGVAAESVAEDALTQTEVGEEEAKDSITIKADNPTKEEMAAISKRISETYNFAVAVRPHKFNFKKSKDKVTGIETVREAVELALPYPNMQGLIDILEAGATPEGAKQLELLEDCISDVINTVARDLLAENLTLTASNFPTEKVSWDAISKMPKAQRGGAGIPKEVWEDFAKDYLSVMPSATGKSLEQVGNMAKILQNKLAQVKTNLPVLSLVLVQLSVYTESTTKLEEYAECVDFISKKAESLLNVTNEELLSAL